MALEMQILLGVTNGLVWGLITALIALGLSIIFGWLEVVNISHGELYMLGAVLGWYAIKLTNNFWIALAIAPAIIFCLGLVVEKGILRTLENNPSNTVIATFGLMLILQQVTLATFGAFPQRMPNPVDITIPMFGFGYSGYRLFTAAFSVAIMIMMWFFLHRTKYGLWVRACRQDREMAMAMGLSANQIYMITFGLGAALAAIGGILAAPIVAVDYLMGFDIIILSFIIVVVGGLGSLKGSVVAALMIGLLEGVAAIFVTPTEARVITLLFMVAVVLVRPAGLFGKVRR